MIKSPNPVPCPPGILKVFEDHVETIRRTHAVGDIFFDAKTGEIKANKHCPMCDGMMDNPHSPQHPAYGFAICCQLLFKGVVGFMDLRVTVGGQQSARNSCSVLALTGIAICYAESLQNYYIPMPVSTGDRGGPSSCL